jgi:two-component system, OmpR family, phosphate regulon response regulator PhoB
VSGDSSANRIEPAGGIAQPRILVVDDEDLVRLVIATMLRVAGFDVDEARDGLEALARLAERRADLVLTDLNMPRCNGEELCRAVRRQPATAAVPVLLMTGGPIEEARMRAAGFIEVIYKPLPITLPDLLRAALRKAAALPADSAARAAGSEGKGRHPAA